MASWPRLMVRYWATAVFVNTKLLMMSSGYVAMYVFMKTGLMRMTWLRSISRVPCTIRGGENNHGV
jgi:hypothetical protein